MGLNFKNLVCNGCCGLLMSCLNFSDITIIIAKVIDYCCIVHDIRKSDASHLSQNSEISLIILLNCKFNFIKCCIIIIISINIDSKLPHSYLS